MAKSKADKIAQAIATQKRAKQRAIDKANSPEQRAKKRLKIIASQEKTRAKQQTPEYKEEQAIKRAVKSAKAFENKIAKSKANWDCTPSLKTSKPSKPIKSKGLAGKSVNASEKELHNKIVAIGCIACINAGITTAGDGSYVSVHHCDGRTKPHAHEHCIGLCAWHHQVAMSKEQQALYPNVFPIHANLGKGGKVAWEKVNGTQEELIVQLWAMIGYTPIFSTLLNTNK